MEKVEIRKGLFTCALLLNMLCLVGHFTSSPI